MGSPGAMMEEPQVQEAYEGKQIQKQALKSSAKQLQREEVRLEQMFHDHLAITFELENLQTYDKSPDFSRLQDGCIKRSNLTQKLIMNHLEDQETYTPHGKILRERFCQKAEKIVQEVKQQLKPGCLAVLKLEDFLDAVKSGQNRWHDKDVIEPGSCKPLDDASANYVMKLLNKGLIETDKKTEHFKKTGKAKVSTLQKLFKEAQRKIEEEVFKAKHKKKSEADKFKGDFQKHTSKKEGNLGWV